MILNEPYNKDLFDKFLKDFLPDYQKDERQVRTSDKSILTNVTQLGISREIGISVLEAECEETDTSKRIAITQAAFKVLRDHSIRNAIIAFHDGTNQWRLSLLTSTLDIKDGKVVKKDSNPRRYSYLLGVGAKTVTPYKYLIEKGQVADIKQLQERFSVEVVNKQFYTSIANLFTNLIGGERGITKYPGLLKLNGVVSQNVEHQEFAVRLIGRIIFCWFLKEKKSTVGVPIIPDELLSLDAIASNADYYHSIMEPLFFELLNKRVEQRQERLREVPFSTVPYLNGGLFSPQNNDYYVRGSYTGATPSELVYIPDTWFTELFSVLEQYNFTVDENTSYDIDLSIDPEMLGRIFENLLAEINPETGESARKSTGSFYTPREIVDYMVDSSLLEFLKNRTEIEEEKLKALISWGKSDDELYPCTEDENKKIVKALANLTILDPACGSGAFPIGILQKVVYMLQQVDEKAELWLENQLKSITSPELRRDIEEKYRNENYDYLRKLGVIRESIFGVDIQTIATEISKLRCFLTLVIEEDVDDAEKNRGIRPLPNLDFKFVTANSLVGLPDSKSGGTINLFEDISHIDRLKNIRNRYFGADADERARLQIEFKDLQLSMFKSRLASMGATSDLYNVLSDWNPFSHDKTEWFDSEWMFGIDKFDISIANPPYKQLKKGVYSAISFPYSEGSDKGKQNLYKLFIEFSIRILKPRGIFCLITQSSLLCDISSQFTRELILKNTTVKKIIEFPKNAADKSAQVFSSVLQGTSITLLINSESSNEHKFELSIGNDIKTINSLIWERINQRSLLAIFPNGFFIPLVKPNEFEIVNKISAHSIKLSSLCKEITKGDLNLGTDRNHFSTIQTNTFLYRGENVHRYLLDSSISDYIKDDFKKDCISKNSNNQFIVCQNITGTTDKYRLHFCLTRKREQYLFGDSVNKVLLKNELFNLQVLGILNSKLMDWFFRKTSTNNHVNGYELESLPINENWSLNKKISEITAEIINSINNSDKVNLLQQDLNFAVYELYGLDEEEIKIIEESAK